MELTAVSFVIILFGTAWCWKDKPSDVGTTITVPCLTTMEDILIRVSNEPLEQLQQSDLHRYRKGVVQINHTTKPH